MGIIDDKRWEHQEFRLKMMSSYHECMDKYAGDYILPNIINSLDQVDQMVVYVEPPSSVEDHLDNVWTIIHAHIFSTSYVLWF